MDQILIGLRAALPGSGAAAAMSPILSGGLWSMDKKQFTVRQFESVTR